MSIIPQELSDNDLLSISSNESVSDDELLEGFPERRQDVLPLVRSRSARGVYPSGSNSLSSSRGSFYRHLVDSASKSFSNIFDEADARETTVDKPFTVPIESSKSSPVKHRRAVTPANPMAEIRLRVNDQATPVASSDSPMLSRRRSQSYTPPPMHSAEHIQDDSPAHSLPTICSNSIRNLDMGSPYRSPRRLLEESTMGLTPTEDLLNSDDDESSTDSSDSSRSEGTPDTGDIPGGNMLSSTTSARATTSSTSSIPVFLPELTVRFPVSQNSVASPSSIKSHEDPLVEDDTIHKSRKMHRRGSYSAPASRFRGYRVEPSPKQLERKGLLVEQHDNGLGGVIPTRRHKTVKSSMVKSKVSCASSNHPLQPWTTLQDKNSMPESVAGSGLFQDAELVEPGSVEVSAPSSTSSSARTSFTADSPYYTSYVEQEMQQLKTLNGTLRDISARAKTFGKCGALMAESTRRLALACKLRPSAPNGDGTAGSSSTAAGEETAEERQERERMMVLERQESVGEEMGTVLSVLGDVLNEIADAQVQMCDSLEASLALSLEAFCGTELQQVNLLKTEAEAATETAESAMSRYLNSRHAPNNPTDKVPTDSWNKVSDAVTQQLGGTYARWKRGELAPTNTKSTAERVTEGIKNWRGSSASGSNGLGAYLRDEHATISSGNSRHKRNSVDPSMVMASTAANLQLSLEHMRLAQATAELKRFQLLKKIVNIKKRRNFELGENALASLHGIRAYFHHCSDLVQGLAPRMNRFQEDQKTSRDKHQAELRPWENRQQGLLDALDKVGSDTLNAQIVADGIAQGDDGLLEDQATSLDVIESRTHIWEIPLLLAESSRYQRDPAPGVIVEGWLYKKSSSRMALTPWNRRWFMMDKDCIYYFRSSNEVKKTNGGSGYLHTLERVKVCDVVLCMVREVPPSDGNRFCFELVTPTQKPLMLQSRGPAEYNMWVNGIRSGVEMQLVHGNVSADSLMKGLGKKKRGSGVPDNTLGSMLGDEALTARDGVDASLDITSEVPTPEFREQLDSDEEGELRQASAQGDLEESSRKRCSTVVSQIMEANPVCADCGMPDPDWAAINLGVIVCIECSGVHRSLGVHVSKVRSLMLDSLSETEGRLLLDLGNDRINPIWEAGLSHQHGWTKPTESSSRKAKEEWIRSKYQWKGFVGQRATDGMTEKEREETYSRELYEAARAGRLLAVADAIAHGANVDWRNRQEAGRTALHVCAIGRPSKGISDGLVPWQGIECAELLLQNGAKMAMHDDCHHGVLDSAMIGNAKREMIEYLSARTA